MGETWKYYDVADFNNWKRKQLQAKAYRAPPRANFLAAANCMTNFLEGKKFNWAAFGGLAMLCLGFHREMSDIHIVYEDRDFQRIKSKLEADPRVRLPKGMNSLFPTKLLIQTGPNYKDAGCTENVDVEVDLVPPGSHGTPSNDVLRRNQVMLRLSRDGKGDSFKGLNMLYLVKTTIYYCKSQDLAWDARNDLLFLCQHYGKEIESIRHQLNPREVQENFLGTPSFSRLPPEEQRQCYHILLGKEPPPAMFITSPASPVGHRPTASASDIPRPRIPSHKSTPSLNSAMQQPSHLLSPPLPSRPKAAPAATASAPPTQTSAPPAPRLQGPPVNSAAGRDSRSRYRHTSAPNTPSVSRNVSPETSPPNASRPKSMDMRPPHQQSGAPFPKPQPVGMRNGTHAPRPHMVSGNGPAPMAALPVGMRPQKSMPDIIKRSTGSVPIFVHGQKNVSPVPKNPPMPAQMNSAVMPPGLAMSQRPQPKGSPQGIPTMTQNNAGPKPAATQNPQMPAQQLPPRQGPAHHTQQGLNNHKGNAVASKPYHAEPSASTTRALHLMGPEGLYLSPLRPNLQPGRNQPPASGPQANASTTSSTFVFELDASSPQAASAPHLPNGPPNRFIAELPAEMDAPRPSRADTQPSPLQGPSSFRDSPVSPPINYHPAPAPAPVPAPAPHAQAEQQARPSNPPMQSAPLDALPASLVVGGHRRSPQNSVSHPPPPQPQPTGTQPYHDKYQRYYSPPSSAPNITNPSPKQAAAVPYKAYSGPISPPSQPASAPAELQKPPSMAHIQASMAHTQHHAPTHAPIPNNNMPPPNVLRAGPQQPPTQKFPPPHFPNPLGANPPTPPITSLTKHDSHQNHQEHVIMGGAAAAGAGVVGGVGYAAYSYHTSEHTKVHAVQHQTGEYTTFGTAHEQNKAYDYTPYKPTHQRNPSHESNASHDSAKLAQEYQIDLPDFDNGYGSGSDGRRHEEEYVDFT